MAKYNFDKKNLIIAVIFILLICIFVTTVLCFNQWKARLILNGYIKTIENPSEIKYCILNNPNSTTDALLPSSKEVKLDDPTEFLNKFLKAFDSVKFEKYEVSELGNWNIWARVITEDNSFTINFTDKSIYISIKNVNYYFIPGNSSEYLNLYEMIYNLVK